MEQGKTPPYGTSVARKSPRHQPVPPRPFEVVLTPPRPLPAAEPPAPAPTPPPLPEVLPEPVRALTPPTGARATLGYRSPHVVGAVVRELAPAKTATARRPRPWPVVLGGLGAGVLVMLGLLGYALLVRSPRQAPVAEVTPRVIHIAVETAPADARVFLDQAEVTERPIVLPRSTQPRHLVIRADGFEAQEMDLVPDRDRELRIALAPVLPGPPAPPAVGRRGQRAGKTAPPRRSLYLGDEL